MNQRLASEYEIVSQHVNVQNGKIRIIFRTEKQNLKCLGDMKTDIIKLLK